MVATYNFGSVYASDKISQTTFSRYKYLQDKRKSDMYGSILIAI